MLLNRLLYLVRLFQKMEALLVLTETRRLDWLDGEVLELRIYLRHSEVRFIN
nr:MAG TPA: hypothetical protein [Caudoviricetes sp.]